jgi:hypothetical protein
MSDLLCDSLPDQATELVERHAIDKASAIMASPVAVDAVTTLGQWAEFLAPLYDFADLRSTPRLYSDLQRFADDSRTLQPKGPRLLSGALKTATIALAQLNSLYGDVLAREIFEDLWDSSANAFRSDLTTLNERQRTALSLLGSNPYIQRNVLMLGLDRAYATHQHIGGTLSGDGRFAYELAVQMLRDDVPGFRSTALNTLFGDKWGFTLIARSAPSTPVGERAATDKRCRESATPTTESACEIVPVARVLGLDVPLPSTGAFANRQFDYPAAMRDLIQVRDAASSALANYRVFKSLHSGSAGQLTANEVISVMVGSYDTR